MPKVDMVTILLLLAQLVPSSAGPGTQPIAPAIAVLCELLGDPALLVVEGVLVIVLSISG